MCDFHQNKPLIQLIDRNKFDSLCEKWGMDYRIRTFSTWQQTECLLLSYILRLGSLREIEEVLGIARSTFSDANQNRPAAFFQDLCKVVLEQIKNRTRDRKLRRAIRTLIAIDCTESHVHGSLSRLLPWRRRRATGNKATVRLHAAFDIEGEWIEEFKVTPCRKHENPVAKRFKISSPNTYIFDRAYDDLDFWYMIAVAGAHFVTRLKTFPKLLEHTKVILKRSEGKDGVLWEGIWKPSYACLRLHPNVPKNISFRHIIYRDPEAKRLFHFVTSDRKRSAQKIADIYKKRWAVELLFRWLKGHLNIRYFATKNPNAVKIQMMVAVLVQLLIRLLSLKVKFEGTLWECLRELRSQLAREGLRTLASRQFMSGNRLHQRL